MFGWVSLHTQPNMLLDLYPNTRRPASAGTPRDHDLLFWAVLQFNATGGVQAMHWADNATLDLA